MPTLNEAPHFSLRQPAVLFARQNGKYTRPVTVIAMDLRAEDHAFKQAFKWVGKLPSEDRWLIYDGMLVADDATREQALTYAAQKGLAFLPDGWWTWVEALGPDYEVVKAASKPRPTDAYTPENVDEKVGREAEVGQLVATEGFATKLESALVEALNAIRDEPATFQKDPYGSGVTSHFEIDGDAYDVNFSQVQTHRYAQIFDAGRFQRWLSDPQSKAWSVSFHKQLPKAYSPTDLDKMYHRTGQGATQILNKVLSTIKAFVASFQPKALLYSPADKKLGAVYSRLLRRFSDGYTVLTIPETDAVFLLRNDLAGH